MVLAEKVLQKKNPYLKVAQWVFWGAIHYHELWESGLIKTYDYGI